MTAQREMMRRRAMQPLKECERYGALWFLGDHVSISFWSWAWWMSPVLVHQILWTSIFNLYAIVIWNMSIFIPSSFPSVGAWRGQFGDQYHLHGWGAADSLPIQLGSEIGRDLPWGKLTYMWKITISIHDSYINGPFSTSMFVYARVNGFEHEQLWF